MNKCPCLINMLSKGVADLIPPPPHLILLIPSNMTAVRWPAIVQHMNKSKMQPRKRGTTAKPTKKSQLQIRKHSKSEI